jgi:calreticulin
MCLLHMQVEAGTIFDNILVTDDVKLAREFAESTWGAMKAAEKAAFEEAEKEREAREEEERKKVRRHCLRYK